VAYSTKSSLAEVTLIDSCSMAARRPSVEAASETVWTICGW
jgi:hypothetical protein